MNKLIETIKTQVDSVNDDSVIVTQILVTDGQQVFEDDVLAEIETSKAQLEIISSSEGYIKILCLVDQEVMIGETLFEIFAEEIPEDELNIMKVSVKNAESDSVESNSERQVEILEFETQFSKKAKARIERENINVADFKSMQFVTINDIENFLNPNTKRQNNNRQFEIVQVSKQKSDNRSKTVVLGKQKLNEMNYLSSVNSSGLVSRLSIPIEASLKAIVKSQNFISSTPLPVIVYEVSRLLTKYPNLNSYFESNSKIEHQSINVGVALDNGTNGLKVGSILKCDDKNLHDIEENITDLSLKYNNNNLSLEEISAATFTITDLFATGVSNFHPLVNYNNAAILGICGLVNNAFNIELAFDHRISNGLEVSKFLNDLKMRLETRFNQGQYDKNLTALEDIECYKCLRTAADDLNGKIYFIKVANSKEEGQICSNCFNGF
ncbi:hypothetical protein ESY86_09870 [Subsaximicrobium wynnwilliamsii]|uniref:Dihydrolipoamide acetyltransferase component of pyruvate dehydrogenase complex n=1 Tax=Subsaximicrobium wynnwilliamsii TaxID=291179 RepID=A0A5C6ZH93_9FLAO|nr:2-oxo acid dehydrogenase subunit E2 [Subsaximicrobium wynnwilliamsii]TXD81377.1 hypothetical protein ESY87_18520 [Subsaximicrobium wynnwilliamsii]TXD89073.1 hypothetical protein ESY86_09870 [Subsaximicrobium wynnwilliamsii]TXE00751.1 hypothetical protein ESY88_18615 [Subsaximicrobium wynnwilliamsii]